MKYTALCPSCFNRFSWVPGKGLTKHKCFSDGPAPVIDWATSKQVDSSGM